MELLSNGFTLDLSPNAFPLSTDSVLLADFVRLPKGSAVLDLGSGCGTLGLLLCAKDPGCTVTGVELDPQAHAMALKNIARNGLSARLSRICGDLRDMPPGDFRVCVSNPPYFSGGPASRSVPAARREDSCSLEDLISTAARCLRYGGDFFLVHRPERLAQICHLSCQAGMEPKRMRLVRHRPEAPVSLMLLQCRKGGKPGLSWEELTLFSSDGTPTPEYRAIYHL